MPDFDPAFNAARLTASYARLTARNLRARDAVSEEEHARFLAEIEAASADLDAALLRLDAIAPELSPEAAAAADAAAVATPCTPLDLRGDER